MAIITPRACSIYSTGAHTGRTPLQDARCLEPHVMDAQMEKIVRVHQIELDRQLEVISSRRLTSIPRSTEYIQHLVSTSMYQGLRSLKEPRIRFNHSFLERISDILCLEWNIGKKLPTIKKKVQYNGENRPCPARFILHFNRRLSDLG